MDLTDSIVRFRRHLKRRNLSPHTIRSYLSNLKQFIVWVDTPIEEVTYLKIGAYIDLLLRWMSSSWWWFQKCWSLRS